MKKKIGDLTMYEIAAICEKNIHKCKKCPLAFDINTDIICKHEMKANNIYIRLDEEIEVEEE